MSGDRYCTKCGSGRDVKVMVDEYCPSTGMQKHVMACSKDQCHTLHDFSGRVNWYQRVVQGAVGKCRRCGEVLYDEGPYVL